MTASRRVAHTASFLQTFHTGSTTAARREAAGAEGSEPFAAPADADAIAFVKGQRIVAVDPGKTTGVVFAQPVAESTDTEDIKGWKVRTGGANVSAKQAAWIIDIATTREGVTEAMTESVKVRLEQGFAKFAGSQFITSYKDLPRKAQSAAKAEAIAPGAPTQDAEVPAGRYAVVDPTDGVIKFYRLDRPTEGRWAGYVFLKVQASDELHPIRNHAHRDSILAAISTDIDGCAAAYGQLLGKCYACGRTLTDETSRALGIGPDCRAKH
jgi:hypothetical protein